MKKLHGIWFFLWMLTGILLLGGTVSAKESTTNLCEVVFQNNSGSKQYEDLKTTVAPGKSVVLPKLPVRQGMRSLGWTIIKNGKIALYKPDDKVRIRDNTSFYAVYKKKICELAFYQNNGEVNRKLLTLWEKVEGTSKYTLPELPEKTDYRALGWAASPKASKADYAAGQTITVYSSMKFYAVYRPKLTVSFYSNDGKQLISRKYVKEGSTVTFPSVCNGKTYTMLGWSAKKGQHVKPDYEVKETLTVKKNMKFYMVTYNFKEEKNYTGKNLPVVDRTKYRKVIFVGDSRMRRTKATFAVEFGLNSSLFKNVGFVCEGGSMLDWLQDVGYKELLKEIRTSEIGNKPIAIIFNHGVNDLSHAGQYISYMKEIAPKLKKKNCVLYYMSVNPVNRASYLKSGRTSKKITEEGVLNFNKRIRTELCNGEDYTFIDSYHMLLDRGFSYNAGGSGYDIDEDDGLHFSAKTSKRVYAYCVNLLNQAS